MILIYLNYYLWNPQYTMHSHGPHNDYRSQYMYLFLMEFFFWFTFWQFLSILYLFRIFTFSHNSTFQSQFLIFYILSIKENPLEKSIVPLPKVVTPVHFYGFFVILSLYFFALFFLLLLPRVALHGQFRTYVTPWLADFNSPFSFT